MKKIESTVLAPTAVVTAEEQRARSSALAKRQIRRYRPNAENDARQTGGKTASSQVAPARFVTSRQSSYLRTNVAYTASCFDPYVAKFAKLNYRHGPEDACSDGASFGGAPIEP